MEQLIGQYGSQIELVLANNDDMALGALDAYKNMNYTEAAYPVVFGIDGTKAGLEAINTVISKVYDEDLALDLNRQAVRFLTLEDKVTDKIREGSRRPEQASPVGKAVRWTSIQANTLLNTSTEHVADLMIQGNAKGITDLMKAVKANRGARKEYCELAEEIMDFEEKNIERLKSYLKD